MFSIRALRSVPPRLWAFYALAVLVAFILNGAMFWKLDRTSESCRCVKCGGSVRGEFKYDTVEHMCFVSVPRPLTKPSQYKTMKVAMASWLACSPKSSVLLFIDRESFDPSGKFPRELENEFGKDRIIYAGPIRTDYGGVPFINEWFNEGILQSPSRYVCFINSDILLSNEWLGKTKRVFSAMEGEYKPLLIGQRIDFDMKDGAYDELRFAQNDLLVDIDAMVQKATHSDHSPYGIDTFTFRADAPPFDAEMIPPYIMGRFNWDNWLIGWLNSICDTVTVGLSPPIYHINHRRHGFNVEDPRVAINHYLKLANKNFFGSNYDARWKVAGKELLSRDNRRVPI